MFYAEISTDLKDEALFLIEHMLEQPGPVDPQDAPLMDFAILVVGFVGLHVDYPVSEFQHGLGERKWKLVEISPAGFFFDGEDETEVDRVLWIPKDRMVGMRFMFRDPEYTQKLSVSQRKAPAKFPKAVAEKGPLVGRVVPEKTPEAPEEFYPGSYRDGGGQ